MRRVSSAKLDAYRFLAPYYEWLVHLIFRDELHKAHQDILCYGQSELLKAKQIIWIGGGTGYCLHDILERAPQAKLIYIEPSWAMMKRAQAQVDSKLNDRVEWVLAPYTWLFETPQVHRWSHESIDVILTFFFLDVLPKTDCNLLMNWAQKQGVTAWFFADFIPQQKWYKIIFICFMYQCFALTTKIEQRHLLNHHVLFEQTFWEEQLGSARLRAGGLVKSCLFKPNQGN